MCGGYFNKELMDKFNKVAVETTERYHIHIYFDPGAPSEKAAQDLVKKLTDWYGESIESTGKVGRVGPHTKPNLEIDTRSIDAGELMTLLQTIDINAKADELSVLVHQDTDSFLKDHTDGAIWFGKPVPFNPAFVARFTPPNNRKAG